MFSLQTLPIKCSTVGIKILDDILGFDDGGRQCEKFSSIPLYDLEPNSIIDFIDPPKLDRNPRYHKISLKNKVKCPESAQVILVAGQSNSANHVVSKKYANSQHVNYYDKKCYSLENPVLGATGHNDSVVPAIAAKLKSTSPYIFLTVGWGGTSIIEWGKENSGLSRNVNKNLRELNASGHNLHAVVWIQGESDNGRVQGEIIDDEHFDYAHYFNEMKDQMFEGLDNKGSVKFIVTQTSICNGPRDIKLNDIQKSLGRDKNTYVTMVTDSLDLNYRYDVGKGWAGCHFNKFGTEEIAKEISSILNR
jgi:hypothetical protein